MKPLLTFILVQLVALVGVASLPVAEDAPLKIESLKKWPVGVFVYQTNELKQVLARKLTQKKGDVYFWQYHTGCKVQTKLDPFLPRLSWDHCGNWLGELETGHYEISNYNSPWPLKKGKTWKYQLKKIVGKSSEPLTASCESFGNQIVGLANGRKFLHKVVCQFGHETISSFFDEKQGVVFYEEKSFRGIPTVQKTWFLESKADKL